MRLEQRLGDARHVAVPEDAEAAGEEPLLGAVALGPLDGQEPDQRLGDGEPYGTHAAPSLPAADVSGSRGSTCWPRQVPRTQACAGSSQNSQARSSAGPAITLR